MNDTTRTQDLCRVAESFHCAAERVADVHGDLGPEAAVAAVTLLGSPTILGLLRRVALSVVAAVLTIDPTLNTRRDATPEPSR